MTVRRPSDVSVHEWQHRLITERTDAWRKMPTRSGVDKLRRREATKRAYWTIRGHLQSEHGRRNAPMTALIDDLTKLHDTLHADH